MQVKSIAECSKGSILQYFRPSLSYHLSLRYLFCLFLSGRFRQVLLYFNKEDNLAIYNCLVGQTVLFCQDIIIRWHSLTYLLLDGQKFYFFVVAPIVKIAGHFVCMKYFYQRTWNSHVTVIRLLMSFAVHMLFEKYESFLH